MRASSSILSLTTILGAAALVACAGEPQPNAGDSTPVAAPAAPAAVPAADPDQSTAGGGVPAGYTGRTDREGVDIAGARYTMSGGRWEVRTGPAHIIWAAKDSARGAYTATASFDQLEAPQHPEAFGLVIGGQALDAATQRYTYFIVRGTGEYAVKARDGATTRDVVKFSASDALPKADASGKASYRLAAQVTADSVHFMVNDRRVTSVAKGSLPTDGIAALRINHNLHLLVSPVAITR